VRVLVVDDHPVVRAGMVALLSESPTSRSSRRRPTGPRRWSPCLNTPSTSSSWTCGCRCSTGSRRPPPSRRSPTHPHVLILTTYDTDADIVRAVEAGARGYLLKDTPPRSSPTRSAGLHAARPCSPRDGISACHATPDPAAPSDLTARELEVLHLVAQGLSNAEVGGRLFIGEATVKTHLVRIFGKLGGDRPHGCRHPTRRA
jgi:DNA-binding NarL/FixJ family response regulator